MLKGLFSKASREPRDIIVVSGLPRSGTSMMMKMLAQGGLEILTDAVRGADEDNPNGYYELEAAKELAEGRVDWVQAAHGKVVKVISALLEHLPAGQRYKVLFMERTLEEVLASQKKMLDRRDQPSSVDDREMQAQFGAHLATVKYWLPRQPNIDVLYVDYNQLLAAPRPGCQAIADFLGLPLDVEQMCAVPNERLYRNRAPRSGA
jgi:hypothetical protein